MPWQPLPRIAFAVATYPFAASSPADLPLEIGDELYVIEETPDGSWLRGYLVAPPSLLAGLTSVKGQTLEARVFSGIFPRSCVEVREMLGESNEAEDEEQASDATSALGMRPASGSVKSGVANGYDSGKARLSRDKRVSSAHSRRPLTELPNGISGKLSVPVIRDPNMPRPAAPVPMLKIGDETPTSASEPLIDEIASCLREWHSKNLHELLLSRQYARLDQLSALINSLNFSRQQFLYNVLTSGEYERLRERTIWELVRANKLCGCEVIVRDPKFRGRVLTGDDSVVEITKLQSVMSLLDEPSHIVSEPSSLHHLFLEVKGFAGSSTEKMSLSIYLVTKSQLEKPTTLTESFNIDISAGGTIGSLSKSAQRKALFTDLSPQDIGDLPSSESDLYLVVRVNASREVATIAPLSRNGTATQTSYAKDTTSPVSAGGTKSSRRSLMWAATKTTRSAFSRGAPASKMSALSEGMDENHAQTSATRDSTTAPGTGSSRNDEPIESVQTVQRTVGLGVLKLNGIMKQQEEVEQVVSIWSQSSRYSNDKDGQDGWDSLIQDLMDSPQGYYEKSRTGERLQVHLQGFTSPDADSLIKATPAMLSSIVKTNRIGFSGAPTRPRSDIYITVSGAALAKQNLLSRYGGSATNMPPHVQANNLQVVLEVRKSSGERIENCIYTASNAEVASTFRSVAVERGERWDQTVRLSIPQKDVAHAHVVVFLSDLPHPPFAIAHMPLWGEQAFIRDGPHSLFLYKIDENTSTPLAGPSGKGGYLSLPWTAPGKDEFSTELTGPLAVILLNSFLCSTSFSQDRVILGLLKWKDCSRDDVTEILKQLVFVPEIEVVKVLSDVLDCLFGILLEHNGNDELEDLVFTALVRVLGIVHDRRFNLGPLVDQYAETRFNYPFATSCLIQSFSRLLSDPTNPEIARKLRSTFKVVRHILKFIAQARSQQQVKEAGIGIKSSTSNQGFSRQLRSIFKCLDAMMANTAPALVGSQTLAVQHFHSWLPELSGLLKTEEILHIAIDFMDSCTQVKGKLILYKLILIINYSKLDLFAHPEQKAALSANTVRWISPHWGHSPDVNDQWREQIRLCCSVLASQIEHMGPEIPDHIPKIINSYLAVSSTPPKPRKRLSLLFPSSYPFPSKALDEPITFDETLAELSAVLSAVSNSPSGMQLELADDDLTTMIESLLRVQMSILSGEAFPTDWLSVHIYHHKSTMRTLEYLSGIMLESFLPDPDDAEGFNTELWKAFFTTLLQLVSSPSLALETLPEQKRRAVWKIAGDVREHGAELLRRMWEAIGWETSPDEHARYGLSKIGGYQVQYVPTLVGPIVELCLSVHEGLRRMAVEVVQTMIISEWTLSEDLSVIQTEMIDSLDTYFKTKPLTDSTLQKLFIGELLDRFKILSETPDDPLYTALSDLIGTLEEFLDLLVAVYSGGERGEVSNIINHLRLMEFLRDMRKEEIFIRYVHQLAALQSASGNHAEAGLALRLHADLYDWNPTKQTPALTEPDFPLQTLFERKEKIYFDMIKHFEEGQSWSNALTAYKELQLQYETNIFDFAKLARTERAIATIYETVSKSEKVVPRYFRVVYKGLGFPAGVRDKEFVYEGWPAERASAFTDRMQEQYPAAQILAGGDVDEVEGQFLVISTITPHRDLSHPTFQRTRVPQVIRDFLLASHPQAFSISTKRVTTGPPEEHYAEKTIFTTAEPFPTILRRSEIIETTEVRLNAYETALERIVRKTQEMTVLERRIADGDEDNAHVLVDAVSVSVNPNSDNSIASYRRLLPEPDVDSDDEGTDDQEPPELEPPQAAIKMALIDHAIMLKRCLALFSRLSNESLSRRQEELQFFYESTYAPEIMQFAPPQPQRDMISSPMSGWRTPSPIVESSPSRSNIADIINGVKDEDTAIAQPVGLRQRGTRLSFLGAKKSQPRTSQDREPPNVDFEAESQGRTSSHLRRNIFRSHSIDDSQGGSGSDGASRSAGGKSSLDKSSSARGSDRPPERESGIAKRAGSVRKRFSMLTLSRKASKGGGMMGSLNEE
ncbi:SH3 domain-containing protein [Stachybotrys elegans]|uniref:SH3 domain-containing protein n=1 Tax=Stachybotrys elegans TaxID=80388 RepID=A0A8K0SQT0_9HYPO|nr:SH3 domain-containing protein [Stachybotrys elegans]